MSVTGDDRASGLELEILWQLPFTRYQGFYDFLGFDGYFCGINGLIIGFGLARGRKD